MIKKSFLFIAIVFFLTEIAYADKKTVAVMNFTNYGGAGMKFLSNSVPESISTALSEMKELRVVERRQLGKIVDEIALEQTGLVNTNDVSRAGQLAKADILFIGSIAGDPGQVFLTIKAVDVASGNVLQGKTIRAPLANLFDQANQAAKAMGAAISGLGVGMLSISTTPQKSVVYIDGANLGPAPIVEYKLTEGSHTVKVVHDGFLDFEDTIHIKPNSHERLNPILGDLKSINRSEFALGVNYLFSFGQKDIEGAPYYYLHLAHTFSYINIHADAGFAYIEHDQNIKNPFGTDFEQKRWLLAFNLQGGISYIPFRSWQIIQPYAGITLGATHFRDYRTNKTLEDPDELLTQQSLVSIGARGGFNILPFSKISLFVESRICYYPHVFKRVEFESQGLAGQMKKVEKSFNLMTVDVGGGLKFFF